MALGSVLLSLGIGAARPSAEVRVGLSGSRIASCSRCHPMLSSDLSRQVYERNGAP